MTEAGVNEEREDREENRIEVDEFEQDEYIIMKSCLGSMLLQLFRIFLLRLVRREYLRLFLILKHSSISLSCNYTLVSDVGQKLIAMTQAAQNNTNEWI